MRKVLFILNDLGGGGAERVFINIANAFIKNNIHVEFLVGKKQGIFVASLDPSIRVMEAGGTSLLRYLRIFPRIFKKNKYTHIFTAGDYASTAAILSKKMTGQAGKIYMTHHYSFPGKRPLKYLKDDAILKFIHFFITPNADKIIAVSQGSLSWLRRFSHHKLKQGTFIYNPVFDDTIYTLAEEPVNFPVNTDGKIVLLNAGRLAEQKDHITLIKAFCIVRQTYPNAVLFILGTGVLKPHLEEYISENDLSRVVFLIGFEANPYKWMAKCDVFVLSSLFEGFGNVLAEAMALGKTVASTDCPSGPSEILKNGHLGYLCPVQDPAKLSAAIVKAIETPVNRNLLLEASLKYKIDRIVKQYLEIL